MPICLILKICPYICIRLDNPTTSSKTDKQDVFEGMRKKWQGEQIYKRVKTK